MSIASYVLGAIVLLVIFFTMKAVVIISQSETKVIERLGKYYATLQPGINIIMPFLDHAKEVVAVKGGRYVYTSTIDLREQVYDFARQNVITKDNIQMQINALLYFQIVDPFKAVYEINNLPNAIEKLTQTTLRNIIGEMELDQTLTQSSAPCSPTPPTSGASRSTASSCRTSRRPRASSRPWRSRCRLSATSAQRS